MAYSTLTVNKLEVGYDAVPLYVTALFSVCCLKSSISSERYQVPEGSCLHIGIISHAFTYVWRQWSVMVIVERKIRLGNLYLSCEVISAITSQLITAFLIAMYKVADLKEAKAIGAVNSSMVRVSHQMLATGRVDQSVTA